MQDAQALDRFVREHHVHYEVLPEEAFEGGRRDVVGFDVRLFGTHGDAKLEAPACPRCTELLAELRSFAESVVSSAHAAERSEIVSEPQALYQSKEVPGADEVAVTVRVRCASPDHRRPGSGEDPCLAQVRQQLDDLHVPRR